MNKIESTLFNILQASLNCKKLVESPDLRPEEWKMLYEESVRQSVGALVYRELEDSDCSIPSEIRSQWLAYSEYSKRRFDTQLLALSRLSALLDGEEVRMMVLKGIGIAVTYPQPELRECGDIDIFCYEDYDKVNEFVLDNLDKNARETEEKHFGFEINGIEVENHRKFCSDTNHANRFTGNILMKMSQDKPYEDSRLPGILFPSARMGALHLIVHTLSHLWWSGITLRHLCDLTAYIRAHKDELDFDELRSILKEARLEKSAALLISICNKHLGLGLDIKRWEQYGEDAGQTVLHSIFHPFKNSCFTADPFKKFYRKVVMHRFRRRLYRLVYEEKYPESFLESFVCLK